MTAPLTTRSRQLQERLLRVMPGGDTRSVTFRAPYSLALEKGDGYLVWDVDGNQYIDLNSNNTSLVHGHRPKRVMDAVARQLQQGTVFPSPSLHQAEHAERLQSRVPSMELLRYANSGTEAIMFAVRAARAFTGRDHIVKADMGYHGGWEQVPMTLGVPPAGYGSTRDTSPLDRYPASIPVAVRSLVHHVPYNDVESLRETMSVWGNRVAALLFSP